MALRTKAVSGNAARIPEPEPGEVTVIPAMAGSEQC